MDIRACSLKYSLNGGAKCNLESDRDIHMMLVSKTVSKSDFIDIEVVDNSTNTIADEHDQSDMGMELSDTLNDVNPALLGDDRVEQVVSLTNLWKTYITEVKQVFYDGVKEFRQQLKSTLLLFDSK